MNTYPLIRSFALLMAGVFVSYMLFTAFYTHQHILPDGTVITHAHPYDKGDSSPFKSHHHKDTDLTILQPLKILGCTTDISLTHLIKPLVVDFFEFESIFHDQLSTTHQSVRGPPYQSPALS